MAAITMLMLGMTACSGDDSSISVYFTLQDESGVEKSSFKEGENIISQVSIEGDTVRLKCNKSPLNSKVRYAVNGERLKSGRLHGPRGNLRDSQGETEKMTVLGTTYPVHNWAYQFDMLCK